MKIKFIRVWNFAPRFRDGPCAMSHVIQETACGRIYEFGVDNGLKGLGEVVFAPSLSMAAVGECINDEAAFLSVLVDENIEEISSLVVGFQNRDKGWRGIAFALETAYLDIKAKSENVPVSALLGGDFNQSIIDYFSISERTGKKIKQRLIIAGSERAVIQLKLGIGNMEADIEQISLALNNMADNQWLLADANGGWSVDQATEAISFFDDSRIYWEEPCLLYKDNIAVAQQTGKPIMVDQCVADKHMAFCAVSDNVAAAVCVKPAFLGGLRVAREVRDRCIDRGMKMRIDGPWCGDIANAAILQLAASTPKDYLIAGCDLREPLVIEPDLKGVVHVSPGRIRPPEGNGLGVDIDTEILGKSEAIYR